MMLFAKGKHGIVRQGTYWPRHQAGFPRRGGEGKGERGNCDLGTNGPHRTSVWEFVKFVEPTPPAPPGFSRHMNCEILAEEAAVVRPNDRVSYLVPFPGRVKWGLGRG